MNLNQIFLYAGAVATVIFLAKTMFSLDSGGEIETDFNDISAQDSSFSIFTIESISSFFMSSGWMGYLSRIMGYNAKTSITISIASGILGMLFFVWLISKIKKLEHVPAADINELVGKQGKAYQKFEPNGISKIEIEFNSTLQIIDAKNNTDVEINSFEPIKVVKVENDTVYIEKD